MCAALGPVVTPLFYAALGLGAVNQVVEANQANRQAKYLAQSAVTEAENADKALALNQEGLNTSLREQSQANAQEQMALAKQGRKATAALRASERTGLTIGLLMGDEERETGIAQDLLSQTLASTVGQYRRKTLGLEAQRDDRRNRALETYNKAKGMRRGPLDVALGTLSSGLSSYTNLYGLADKKASTSTSTS